MTLITPPPDIPNRADPATFADRADAYVAWWATVAAEINGGALGATFVIGTVGEPSVRASTDENTGLNFLGSNQLQLVTNGVARLLLTTSAATLNVPLQGTAVTQSAVDDTAGRLTKVGDFGWGNSSTNVNAPSDDLDAMTVAGVYRAQSGATGNPFGALCQVIHAAQSSNVAVQVAIRSAGTGGGIATRQRDTGGTWSSWRYSYDTLSLLGTVSQSGGVPTGAVIERGSNANGEYVRFADGTQICTLRTTISLAIATGFVGGFRTLSQTWTYPAAFSAAPSFCGTAENLTAFGVVSTGTVATTTVAWAATAVTSQTAADRTVSLTAVGRWF